jgi:HAD superfamily hydrolase (TIGR01509 family)
VSREPFLLFRGVLLDYYMTMTTDPYEHLRSVVEGAGVALAVLVDAIIPGRDGRGDAWRVMETGGRDPRDYWTDVADDVEERTGVRLDAAELGRRFTEVPLDPDVVQSARELAGDGVSVGIVSNGYRWSGHHPGLDSLVDAGFIVVVSSDCGLRKPDSYIYEYALGLMGCSAAEVLYLDDNPDFVQGGRAAGLHSILVEDASDTNDRLTRLATDRAKPPAPRPTERAS